MDTPIVRKTTKEVAAGDPFQAAGSRLLNLLAATVGDDQCVVCHAPLNTLGGEGLPHRRGGWICAECAELEILVLAPATAAKTRALSFGYTGEHFTLEEWLALVERYGGRCLRCGSEEQITVDHVVPLSLGGSNSIDNIQPLCEGCNGEKGLDSTDYRVASLEKVG